jgi:hypothetical protein
MPAPRLSPALVRILPFAVYVGLMALESALPAEWKAPGRSLYALQVAATAALLLLFRREYFELREQPKQAATWLAALAVGLGVFVLWINLDLPWATFGASRGLAASSDDAVDVAGLGLRLVGAVLVVPVMEELFWRSFVMRWIEKPDFLSVAPQSVGWKGIAGSALLFGAEHHLWLAGIVAGIVYAWLYRRTGSLPVVIAAHAVTNLALELWVVRTGATHFV